MVTLIHPESYQEEYQAFPYKDLVRIRDQLIKDIQGFEACSLPWVSPWEGYTEISEAESPYTEYIVNLMHLSEISLMILKAYPEELKEQIKAEKRSLEKLKRRKKPVSSTDSNDADADAVLITTQSNIQIKGD